MCSSMWELGMEADQGDLAEIVRATGQGGPGPSVAATSSSTATPGTRSNIAIYDWLYDPNLDDQGDKFSSTSIYEPCDDQFGDPFTDMKDPLMHGILDQMPGAVFFDGHPSSSGALGASMREDHEGSSSLLAQRSLGSNHEQGLKRPTSNIFSRMLQISPSHDGKSAVSMSSSNSSSDALIRELSPKGTNPAASSLVMNGMIHTNPVGVDHGSGMQIISSPRNNGSSIKRRKSQAKKVVCIPAPAAANSRPSGEVVPSDLWAWRKYGQKPIKGSPYPRAYYRCSSSKGCSARKQVERSRADPNMLVITYTSEHNHPWPTQRNALAGSTRSQPPKGNAPNSSKGSLSSNNTQISRQTNNNVLKKEPKESHSTSTTTSNDVNCTASETTTLKDHHVKEEVDVPDPPNDGKKADKLLDAVVDEEFSHGILHHSANKSLPLADHHTSQQHDDFFADLGEFEPDLNLMFCQGFPLGEKHGGGKGNKAAMDPFTDFDWSGNSFGDS